MHCIIAILMHRLLLHQLLFSYTGAELSTCVSKSTLRAKFAVAQRPEPAKLRFVEVAGCSQLLLTMRVLTPWPVAYAELDVGLA
jgi:hypothetical protein